MYSYDHISLTCSWNEKLSKQKLYRKSKHKYYFQWHELEYRDVYEIVWKNMIVIGRPQMTIWRMRISGSIDRTKNTHSKYVQHIAFPMVARARWSTSVVRHSVSLHRCCVIQSPDVFTSQFARPLKILSPLLAALCFSPKAHFTSRNNVLNLYYLPVRVQNVRGSFNFGITKYFFNAPLKFNSLWIKLSLLILMILQRAVRSYRRLLEIAVGSYRRLLEIVVSIPFLLILTFVCF